jgi:cysteinyl-tRNA synthetase
VAEWAADTEEDEGTDWARTVMRSLIVRLGKFAARGFREPHDLLAPAVRPLLDVREELRGTGSYGPADQIREAPTAAGIEIHDTPQGSSWRVS